ncbi:hypothetical protein HQO27_01635 [Rhodococcus fascians]|nr:hypothetical protein [Rhodococcus fascians]MBY4240598.1 hypothetical protein [Rhodococcus fascians]MBY4253449.1 hypothetical protein [Rhodococcus fascians]MBY4269086.1 hypothetical protein [Rhodococcus fascians]MBY4274517.1 hypothetical protein [Rhodococcus fascians]
MSSSHNAQVSARERARQANAQRLAAAQSRLKDQEEDLISYFDATRDEQRTEDELHRRIERLQRDAQCKLEAARRRRAEALAALKGRGETYSSIAALVDVPVPEATRLVKSTMSARSSDVREALELGAGLASSRPADCADHRNSGSATTAAASVDEAGEAGGRSID